MNILTYIKYKARKAGIYSGRITTPTGRTIDMTKHKGWGNSIYFDNWATREISGFMTPKPKVGDVVISSMASGKKYAFEVIHIDNAEGGGSDQFFGTVSDIGYVE